MRTDRQEISRPQRAIRPFRHVFLRDLLNDGLTHANSVQPFRFPLKSHVHHLPDVMMQMRRALQNHLEPVFRVRSSCGIWLRPVVGRLIADRLHHYRNCLVELLQHFGL